MHLHSLDSFFFFFNDTATTEIYTLSLHDALPISRLQRKRTLIHYHSGEARDHLRRFRTAQPILKWADRVVVPSAYLRDEFRDRKSTRLNSSHSQISYAVFCLKTKRNNDDQYCRY